MFTLKALLRLALLSLCLLSSFTLQAAKAGPCAVLEVADEAAESSLASAANGGDACAQFNLGFWHYGQQDYSRAEHWYAKAAKQGNARAAFEIAILYRDDLLTDDAEQRQHWLQQAAEQGLDLAQIELALDFIEAQDQLSAMHWFEQAAAQGNAQAQYLLGEQYWSDQRGVEDAAEGDVRAMRYSGSDAKALYWTCLAAEQDYPAAQYAMSEAYSNGRGLPVSRAQRQLWLQKAAANGHEEAILSADPSAEPWYSRTEQWLQRQVDRSVISCPHDSQVLAQ
ncbi:MAG: tetratricopeptide repeat protein [Pseudomonas sp.]|uniref:tetratricopeptide repeat protein n=1 Tax=Pseudomonas sp. TaxID=306 RepID=UPI0027375017|nr:tetratricopeptide repeat protein [Pseudomonas sp.]MDP3846726.1 tetratricopeptide repeat protein [Pseudomonas sp.]